jgi:predicted acylesterase/phospholipase RssA/CRP-like cAMP-binding protein
VTCDDDDVVGTTFSVSAHEVRTAVGACGLFDSLHGEQLDQLVGKFDGVRLMTGDVLMTEGDHADALYIVRHGRLRAVVGEADLLVGEIGKHQVVGEMAVITDQPRAATVRAMRDTDLYRLPASAFGALVQHHPEMLRPFATVVVERLRTAIIKPAKPSLPATIVIVMLAAADVRQFADQLAAALAPFSTAVITSDDAARHDDAAGWLLDIENEVDLSILIADREPTEWTRRCLRHADHVEWIVDDTTTEADDLLSQDRLCAARFREVPVHLVSMYGTVPTTPRWLSTQDFASYVNIRLDSVTDVDRLARLITGRANIVVLGGGGARGFAHFGVARALHEAGIPVDGIVGTSAGAVIGGLIARVGDPLEAQELMLDWFESVRWRRDFNPPRLAVTSGRLMTEGLQDLGGGLAIEQLPIGFAAVSCDLVSAGPFVHDRGPLWQAIRSSGSVPGLFPPVQVGDRLLVDGGLVANMPTEIARRRHPNARIIAVDVGDPAGIVTGGVTADGIVSGWERLRKRTHHDTVTLTRLLMRLTELGRNDSTESADVTITPDVRGFGITETKHAREIIARGYAAGVEAVEQGLVGPI